MLVLGSCYAILVAMLLLAWVCVLRCWWVVSLIRCLVCCGCCLFGVLVMVLVLGCTCLFDGFGLVGVCGLVVCFADFVWRFDGLLFVGYLLVGCVDVDLICGLL